jgi:hypothetical protein
VNGKGHQHVHIALRVKIVPQSRAEESQFGYLPPPAKVGEFIRGKVKRSVSHLRPYYIKRLRRSRIKTAR